MENDNNQTGRCTTQFATYLLHVCLVEIKFFVKNIKIDPKTTTVVAANEISKITPSLLIILTNADKNIKIPLNRSNTPIRYIIICEFILFIFSRKQTFNLLNSSRKTTNYYSIIFYNFIISK